MAITFEQLITASVTSAIPTTVFLPSDPKPGSALIAAIGCGKNITASAFRHFGADWNLLYENDGANADEQELEAIRVQVWGAFDLDAVVGTQIGIEFGGGTSDRGIIIAEYSGDVFRFPNPADRVVGATGTVTGGSGAGTLNSGSGGITREAGELWVAGVAVKNPVTLIDAGGFMSLRTQADIGGPAIGTVALLDDLDETINNLEAEVDHPSDPVDINWAIAAAALRGVLQIPAEAQAAPVPGEPVTENDDYLGGSIGRLLYQFRAR